MISCKKKQYVAILLATMAPNIVAFTLRDHQFPLSSSSYSSSSSTRVGGLAYIPSSSRSSSSHDTTNENITFRVKSRSMNFFMAPAGGGNDDDNDRRYEGETYDGDDDDDDDVETMEVLPPPPTIDGFLLEDEMDSLTRDELLPMTIAQLKQQLRLRGKKVTGNKSQLIERLLTKNTTMNASSLRTGGRSDDSMRPGYTKYDKSIASRRNNAADSRDKNKQSTKMGAVDDSQRVTEAKRRGADIVDVTDFIDAEEVGKSFRSNGQANANPILDVDIEDSAVEGGSETSALSSEVWGDDARIVDDYEGRSIVVDGLSRTIIEYKGSSNTVVQAYVVGSRDSLKSFLRGGQHASTPAKSSDTETASRGYPSIEEEVYAIQRKREMESKRGLIRPDEADGEEDATDPGTTYGSIERDYGDWGVYTPTGAQLSSAEVQGVLLLSDVYGPFTENTQALADKIAFECQPVVVLAPDLFRGNPWSTDTHLDEVGVERNRDGKTYEEWRDMHPDRRIDVDIRAAAAVLRERYAVSCIAVWGTCFGGGRALEAAAGWYVGGPSSYYEDAFGDRPPPPHVDPVAAVVWYPTRYDARKLFGQANEGFQEGKEDVDRFLGENFGSIEPLSVGDERWSRSTLEMQAYSQKERRDVRSELEEAIANYEDVDIDLRRMSQSVSPLHDGPGIEKIEEIEDDRERIRQQILDKYNISEDDDEETFERKFEQAREDGALNALLLDAYMDGDAYW
ncbi:hypothetical protein ACHAXA_006388 [Cyclostephanos tholiformis]|uniref:SAP domain-containing protein n=1 Tax=Cyclostephanos tholiformis TaxID=382380 RepID=A0ABD3SDZ0_9STRA